MLKKITHERAALALLNYVEQHKDAAYLKIAGTAFSTLHQSMRRVENQHTTQLKIVEGFPFEYPFHIVKLGNYEARKKASFLHVAGSDSLESHKRQQELLEAELVVNIPLAAATKKNASKCNAYRESLKQFFSHQGDSLLVFEPRFDETKPGEFVIQISYKQYEFLKSWSSRRGTASTGVIRGIAERVSARSTGDFSNILIPPTVTKPTDPAGENNVVPEKMPAPDKPTPLIMPIGKADSRVPEESLEPMGELVSNEQLLERRRKKAEQKDDLERR